MGPDGQQGCAGRRHAQRAKRQYKDGQFTCDALSGMPRTSASKRPRARKGRQAEAEAAYETGKERGRFAWPVRAAYEWKESATTCPQPKNICVRKRRPRMSKRCRRQGRPCDGRRTPPGSDRRGTGARPPRTNGRRLQRCDREVDARPGAARTTASVTRGPLRKSSVAALPLPVVRRPPPCACRLHGPGSHPGLFSRIHRGTDHDIDARRCGFG